MDRDQRIAFRVPSAYHEAGHSVCAALHGLLGERASIASGEDASSEDAGKTQLREPCDVEDRRLNLDGYIIAAIAGSEAQTMAVERGLVPIPDDEKEVTKIRAQLSYDPADLEYVQRLLGETDKGKVRQLLLDAAPQARRMLERPDVWSAVEAVARLLIDHGEVTRERVLSLMPSPNEAARPAE